MPLDRAQFAYKTDGSENSLQFAGAPLRRKGITLRPAMSETRTSAPPLLSRNQSPEIASVVRPTVSLKHSTDFSALSHRRNDDDLRTKIICSTLRQRLKYSDYRQGADDRMQTPHPSTHLTN